MTKDSYTKVLINQIRFPMLGVESNKVTSLTRSKLSNPEGSQRKI